MRYGHLLAGILFILFLLLLGYAIHDIGGASKIDVKKPGSSSAAVTTNAASGGDKTVYTEPSPVNSTQVIYTNVGFVPQIIIVPPGTRVTFENSSGGSFRPRSDNYPGTGACGLLLDPCIAISSGNNWTFQFDRTGSWQYYDQTKPEHRGTVIVK
jgi:plastocyanin